MLAKIELRKAVPEDFKIDRFNLKLNQPYLVLDEDGHVRIMDVIRPDLDAFAFKGFLEKGLVYVPLEDHKLKNYLKDQENETV